MPIPRRPAVFLDRDGTIIEEVYYLACPSQVRLLPGAAEAIRDLNHAGFMVIVVTNQAGVARGYFPESRVAEVHSYLAARLADAGAKVDAFYYCPHHERDGIGGYRIACDCRKPRPGMLLRAAREHQLDLAESWMIGDKPSDVSAGSAAGCRSILVRTGYGASSAGLMDRFQPGFVGIAANLAAAVELGPLSRRYQLAG
jgi:D-glycero-D-manno-heptose 1,7-bisphosphate phosphatase